MAEEEIIQGQALEQLFRDLQADEIPLSLVWPNVDDMQPAPVAEVSERGSANHFLIDTPEVCRKLKEESNLPYMVFKFTDSEDIKYVFEADTWQFFGDKVWIRLPQMVHRYQRRKLFRLEAPPGTRLYFNIKDIRCKLLVVNVSMGGTLGVLVRLRPKMEEILRPFNAKILQNAELLFPSRDRKKKGSIVNIGQFQLLRQNRNPATGKFECAIEFKKLSTTERKRLKNLFYKWQRDYLRKRKFLRQ